MTHTRKFADDEGDFGDWRDTGGTGCTQLVPHCTGCQTPTVDQAQEHPGICTCGGYIDDDRCGQLVRVRTWESHDGAYEDYQYRCAAGHEWWIDGIDS
jgi:hypothetical protein